MHLKSTFFKICTYSCMRTVAFGNFCIWWFAFYTTQFLRERKLMAEVSPLDPSIGYSNEETFYSQGHWSLRTLTRCQCRISRSAHFLHLHLLILFVLFLCAPSVSACRHLFFANRAAFYQNYLFIMMIIKRNHASHPNPIKGPDVLGATVELYPWPSSEFQRFRTDCHI